MLKQRYMVIKLIALLAVFCLPALSQPAMAASGDCIPGLPCVTTFTPNFPWDDSVAQNEAGAPNAAKSTTSTCDADFMNQIYAKAFLESERENLLIESVLRKPDSVLEYSCFNQILNKVSEDAPRIFSETTDFSTEHNENSDEYRFSTVELDGDDSDDYEPEADADTEDNPIEDYELEVYMAEGLPDDETRLGNLLEDLVLAGLTSGGGDTQYIDANFYHSFLGGAPTGLNSNFEPEIELNSLYACLQMNALWYIAKCKNFATDDQQLGFQTLAAGLDPRLFPQACEPAETQITPELLAVAENPTVGGISTTSYYDSMRLVNDLEGLAYPVFFTAESCFDPIPTGINVETYLFTSDLLGHVNTITLEHKEHVCINPGCYYDKNANACVK